MNPNSSVLLFIYIYKMILPIYLPIELTNLILEYSGYHRLRNGRYMKQIEKASLFDMAIKIQRMPKIIHGYVKIRVAPTTITEVTTTNNIETTMILFYSHSNYKNSSRL